jgi:hypothetical protein
MLNSHSPINYSESIKRVNIFSIMLICALFSVTVLLKTAYNTNAIKEIKSSFVAPHLVEVPIRLH